MTRDEQDAQDLCCQALIRAQRDLDALQPSTDFRKWLVGVLATTYSGNGFSAGRRRVASQGDLSRRGAKSSTPKAPPVRGIQAALDGLPDELRIPVLLHDVEGLAYQDIARALGIPAGRVRSRIFEGRCRLREALA